MLIWLTPDRFQRKPDKSTWLEMARHLRAVGHRVTILTGGRDSPELSREGLVTVIDALDLPLVFRVTALLNMLRWLWRHANVEDTVILNPDALWLLPPLRWRGIRRIHLDVRTLPVDVHGWKDRLDRLIFWTVPLKLLGQIPGSYSFITERLKREVERVSGHRFISYVIWQSGVNSRLFHPAHRTPEVGARPLRLFYHGSLSINRGLGNVIEALVPLWQHDMEFVVAGDGSGAAELKALVRKWRLEERVHFTGLLPYEHMVDEINRADLCICPLPDRLEWNVSSPLKVFEYMACAKPMILTPIAAHLDVLAGAPFVVWSDDSSPEALGRAIEQAIGQLAALTRAAAVAPALVAERHEWSRQARRLERYLWRAESERLGQAVQ